MGRSKGTGLSRRATKWPICFHSLLSEAGEKGSIVKTVSDKAILHSIELAMLNLVILG